MDVCACVRVRVCVGLCVCVCVLEIGIDWSRVKQRFMSFELCLRRCEVYNPYRIQILWFTWRIVHMIS